MCYDYAIFDHRLKEEYDQALKHMLNEGEWEIVCATPVIGPSGYTYLIKYVLKRKHLG